MLGTASLTKEQERQMLEQQARDMELQIADVKRRLEEVRSGRQTPQPQQYGYPAMAYPYSAEFYGASPYDYAPIPTAPPSAEAELASLEEYRKHLGEEAKGVQERIDELKKQTTRAKSETDETTRKGGE
jgi:DNA-binding transcriptional MerR regulator